MLANLLMAGFLLKKSREIIRLGKHWDKPKPNKISEVKIIITPFYKDVF